MSNKIGVERSNGDICSKISQKIADRLKRVLFKHVRFNQYRQFDLPITIKMTQFSTYLWRIINLWFNENDIVGTLVMRLYYVPNKTLCSIR